MDSIGKQFYCLGFAFNGYSCDEVALIRKLKPNWQKNQLNGIGGKVEKGEDPIDAMRREWQEETGDTLKRDWQMFLLLNGPTYSIHCYRDFMGEIAPLHDHFNGDEVITICSARLLPASCIPNLRWIVPLAADMSVKTVSIVSYDN